MLSRQGISCFCDFVSWPSDLDHISPHLHSHIHPHQIRVLRSAFLLLPSCTTSQIGLVFSPLSMREIRAIVLVDGKTKPAFERADMIFEEIRIFIKVNGFERKLSQSLPPIGICA